MLPISVLFFFFFSSREDVILHLVNFRGVVMFFCQMFSTAQSRLYMHQFFVEFRSWWRGRSLEINDIRWKRMLLTFVMHEDASSIDLFFPRLRLWDTGSFQKVIIEMSSLFDRAHEIIGWIRKSEADIIMSPLLFSHCLLFTAAAQRKHERT